MYAEYQDSNQDSIFQHFHVGLFNRYNSSLNNVHILDIWKRALCWPDIINGKVEVKRFKQYLFVPKHIVVE